VEGSVKQTPLYECHVKYGGRVIDFGGWALPVQYAGIIEEHSGVRSRAGLFDVSHMGEVTVKGKDALAFLQKLVSNDISTVKPGQVRYAHMLYPGGGCVDDLLVYRLGESEEDYMLVINAANTQKDYDWMRDVAQGFDFELANISDDTAELALQGPLAEAILSRLTDADLGTIKYYWCRPDVKVAGRTCLLSRTGYTGEDGFEIFCRPDDAVDLWEAIMEAGRTDGLQPVGLGARDSLRFEASMPLYGQELDAETSPLEAGLGRYVKLDKGDFIGKDALVQRKQEGLKKQLCGLEMIDRGIARTHYPVYNGDAEVGCVTSGMYSPTREKNLAMAYLPPELTEPGTTVEVGVRRRRIKARVIPMPFYRRPR